jgi:hypothetical protein
VGTITQREIRPHPSKIWTSLPSIFSQLAPLTPGAEQFAVRSGTKYGELCCGVEASAQ